MLRFVDFSLCFCTIPSKLFYLQNLSQDSSTQWNKARSSHSLNSQHKKIWNSWCLLCSCRFWQCFRWIGTLSLAVLGFRWILNIPKIDVWPFTKVCFFSPFDAIRLKTIERTASVSAIQANRIHFDCNGGTSQKLRWKQAKTTKRPRSCVFQR